MSKYTTILTETVGRVGLVRLNRPEAMNAFSTTLIGELMDALEAFDVDPLVGALVVTGSERYFAAGADIKEMAGLSAVDMLLRDTVAGVDRIRKIKKPVIAAVSGWCLGAACEFAMACDMIVASENARFGQPEITIGVIPGAGGTQLLTRAVGKAMAMEMILNNRNLSADEALLRGLVNRVAPVERYLQEALTLAEEIAGRAPLAVRMAKEAINHAYDAFLLEGIADERRAFHYLFSTLDQKEGMTAFIEKRPPKWTGQ